jgi:hypothetical protein
MVTIAKTSSKSDAEAGSIRWNKDYWTQHYRYPTQKVLPLGK